MINRPAILYKDYHKKEGEELGEVTVLHIGTVSDQDESWFAVLVENGYGDIIEVRPDRLRFTKNEIS